MPKILSSRALQCLATAVITFTPLFVHAAPGDLYVQVDLNLESGNDGCSIMRVTPAGSISEWVSPAAILVATGESSSDCDDTGLAVDEDGTIYFSEDVSDDILRVTPAGTVSQFVSKETVMALTGNESADFDNGMAIGFDGNLYAADNYEGTGNVLKIILPSGPVTIVVSTATIESATDPGDSDLQGGIARDSNADFFLTEDDTDQIVKVTDGGVASILTTKLAIATATGQFEPDGTPCSDLDTGVVLGNSLFINDDGGCGEDSVISVNRNSGAVSLIISGAAVNAVTGNTDADFEGGIAINSVGTLFIGEDGNTGEDPSKANIVRINQSGSASIFVSHASIQSLFSGWDTARLEGNMAFQFAAPPMIPALSPTGLAILALMLLLVAGTMVQRRRSS
jgi:hypothetical protein